MLGICEKIKNAYCPDIYKILGEFEQSQKQKELEQSKKGKVRTISF